MPTCREAAGPPGQNLHFHDSPSTQTQHLGRPALPLHLSRGRKGDPAPPGPAQPMKSTQSSHFPGPSNGLFVYTAAPPCRWGAVLPFSLWTCTRFAIKPRVPDCKPWWLPSNRTEREPRLAAGSPTATNAVRASQGHGNLGRNHARHCESQVPSVPAAQTRSRSTTQSLTSYTSGGVKGELCGCRQKPSGASVSAHTGTVKS